MAAPKEEGSLLRGPSSVFLILNLTPQLTKTSDEKYTALTRQPSSYKPFETYALEKEKHYQQQFGDMYFLRLTKLKPAVEQIAAEAWDGFQIAGE